MRVDSCRGSGWAAPRWPAEMRRLDLVCVAHAVWGGEARAACNTAMGMLAAGRRAGSGSGQAKRRRHRSPGPTWPGRGAGNTAAPSQRRRRSSTDTNAQETAHPLVWHVPGRRRWARRRSRRVGPGPALAPAAPALVACVGAMRRARGRARGSGPASAAAAPGEGGGGLHAAGTWLTRRTVRRSGSPLRLSERRAYLARWGRDGLAPRARTPALAARGVALRRRWRARRASRGLVGRGGRRGRGRPPRRRRARPAVACSRRPRAPWRQACRPGRPQTRNTRLLRVFPRGAGLSGCRGAMPRAGIASNRGAALAWRRPDTKGPRIGGER